METPARTAATRAEQRVSPLSALGVSVTSERVYRAVLRHPGSDFAALAAATGRTAAELGDDVRSLLDLDLIRVDGDNVVPEPPLFALRRVVAGESRRLADAARSLELAESMVHRYVTEYRAAHTAEREPLTIDLVPASQLLDVLESLVPTTSGEMLFLRPDQWQLPEGEQMDRHVIEALRSGRSSRVIYPFDALREAWDRIEPRGRAGEEVRVAGSVPSRMAVFGGSAVILPDRWGDPGMVSALLLREPSVVSACRALFDVMWSQASAVPGLGDGGAETGRRQLLELLARGAKDEQIARAMGLSLRTVRRRVAAVMTELGVDTRFQAGMEAVRRGWL